MSYDKMNEYIESLFIVFKTINKKAEMTSDKKMKMIGLTIYNYIRFIAKENDVDLKEISEPECINLIPIFEYITTNNIQLYDFSNIKMTDVDISKNEDLERYVLTHIYYITQKSL